MKFSIGSRTFSANRVFCIGKNFEKHIAELGDKACGEPAVFMKPATSLVPAGEVIPMPQHGKSLHHEVEVVVLIGESCHKAQASEAMQCVAGVTLGIDLTLRDVQSRLKKEGLSWELSKSFEKSAPVGEFLPLASKDLGKLDFQLTVNGQVRQNGHTGNMIYSIPELIAWLSQVWALVPGDIVFTGTPSGVGALEPGDKVRVSSPDLGEWSWVIQ